MPGQLIADPNLQVTTIGDFSPGIVNGLANSSVYSTEAPNGSASYAHRCYVRPNIGLCPLPTYTTFQTASGSTSGTTTATIGDIKVYNSAGVHTTIVFTVIVYAAGSNTSYYMIGIVQDGRAYGGSAGAVSFPYNISRSTFNIFGAQFFWPNISKAFFGDGAGNYGATAFTIDPVTSWPFSNATWAMVPGTAGGTQTGTISGNSSFAFTSYATSRGLILLNSGAPPLSSGTNQLAATSAIWASGIQTTSGVGTVGPSFYVPEQAAGYGAWGSVSTGEFVVITQEGGAFLIYGDVGAPSTVIWLPGVQGTGNCIEPGLPTQDGLVYCTDVNGVWLWNGGNTSEKISNNIPDNAILRSEVGAESGVIPVVGQSNMASWGNWVFFPNNWMFDTITKSWWLCEDPNVANFQVQGGVGGSGRFYYAAIGNSVATNTWSLPLASWDKTTSASSYRWISNPLPYPGSIVSLQAVEICASNPTATPCTITITPTAPPGQTPFSNQNPSQGVPFTIPANTTGYRAMKHLGFRDYNVCIQVDASNTNNSNAAPILHDISLGVTQESSMTV